MAEDRVPFTEGELKVIHRAIVHHEEVTGKKMTPRRMLQYIIYKWDEEIDMVERDLRKNGVTINTRS